MVVKLSGGDSYTHGAVVQLGERFACTEEVAGSSPVSSTIGNDMSYWIVEDFLLEDEHKYYLDICDEVYKKSRQSNSIHYSWNEKNNLNKVEGVFDFEPRLRKLASHPKLVTTARHILNTTEPIDTYISKFFPMEPEIGMSTYFHQDNFYFRGNSRKILSCAVYLEDTNKENGCLRIAEESHRYGLFPHDVDSGIPFVKWINEEILWRFNIVDFEMKAPYAVFFDVNLVHGCYPNRSKDTRFSLAWEYLESSYKDVPDLNEHWCDRNVVSH